MANWVYLGDTSCENDIYVDSETIKQTGDWIEHWVLTHYPKPLLWEGHGWYQSCITLAYTNLVDNLEYSVIAWFYTNKFSKGETNPVGSYQMAETKFRIVPGTVGSIIANYLRKI